MLVGEEFGEAEREKLEMQVFRFFHFLFISFIFSLKISNIFKIAPMNL